jgi:GrpB-like predicted nucleotidyltransferase (UPF0157 family)
MKPLDYPVKIVEPSKEVFDLIESYKNIVRKALPKSKVTLIGSFAIPVCGKNEFDLLVEIGKDEDVREAQEKIKEASNDKMGIGPIMENGEGFSRSKKRYGMICELHIVKEGHKNIEKYLTQIKKFKEEPQLAEEYSNMKRSFEGKTEEEYKKAKKEFFKKHF